MRYYIPFHTYKNVLTCIKISGGSKGARGTRIPLGVEILSIPLLGEILDPPLKIIVIVSGQKAGNTQS